MMRCTRGKFHSTETRIHDDPPQRTRDDSDRGTGTGAPRDTARQYATSATTISRPPSISNVLSKPVPLVVVRSRRCRSRQRSTRMPTECQSGVESLQRSLADDGTSMGDPTQPESEYPTYAAQRVHRKR